MSRTKRNLLWYVGIMLVWITFFTGVNPARADNNTSTTVAPTTVAPPTTEAPAAEADAQELTVRHTASPVEVTNLPGRANRSHASYTWRAYFSGLQVYWYTIDVHWTWNHNRVWNVDAGRDGGGSWGWHFCGSRPAGQQWIGSFHKQKKVYGFGHFGHWPISPGCVLGDRVLGGSLTVTRHGTVYRIDGLCCRTRTEVRLQSAPPGLPAQEWALAA